MEGMLPLLAAAPVERSERRSPPGPRTAPWLVFSHGNYGKHQTFYNLCEPNNKTYRKLIPELSRKSYWQKPSHQGWLVIVCDDDEEDYSTTTWDFGDCFLWNPLSLETIKLPTLLHWYTYDDESTQYFSDCVLSSNPTNPDSMVFFLLTGDDNTFDRLLFCRPGKDEQWRTKELSSSEKNWTSRLFCFKGKLYISCHFDPLLEIEIHNYGSNNFDDDDHETLSITSIHVINEPPEPLIVAVCCCSKEYYVQSCDEVFKVVIYSHPRRPHKEVTSFKVLRMNFSLMAWEVVKDLGDHVLFLGDKTITCCSAAELGLTRGCVYYTLPKDKSLYKIDLEDGTISDSLPCPNLPTPWFKLNWVMIPTTVREADGQRRPEYMLGNNETEDIIIEAEQIQANDDNEAEAHKNDGRELEESGTWGTLNENILELIASYVHPVDYLHFRAVCKGNRTACPASSWRNSSSEITPATYLSPWLVSYQPNDAIYNFLDPVRNNGKYFMNLQDFLLDAKIRFSKGGWLLMSKGWKTLFFFNPFTREKIQLPDLPGDLKFCFSGFSFSSLPTSSDCLVVAINYMYCNIPIFYISRKYGFWVYDIIDLTILPPKKQCTVYNPCFNNPVFHNGAFYCLYYDGALGLFDLNDNNYTWNFLDNPKRPCTSIDQSFLVECEGKLLSVFLGQFGKWVRVFRLDFSKMVWVEVQSLGNHMLFISNTSTLSAVAPNNHMKNKIYFPRIHEEEIVYYSLGTRMFHSLANRYSAQDLYNTKKAVYCSWIEPNWSQSTGQEQLDWGPAHTQVNDIHRKAV